MSRRDYTFMANTYTQIHIHFVFAVKFRQAVIHNEWREELYKYIGGIIRNNNHKLLAINGVSDHIHILIGIRPAQSISDLMKYIKQDSSKWINQNKFSQTHFESKNSTDRQFKFRIVRCGSCRDKFYDNMFFSRRINLNDLIMQIRKNLV